MRILIIGGGYVGLAYTSFLSHKYQVTVHDINKQKILDIESGDYSSSERELSENIIKNKKNISAISSEANFEDFKFILLCLPTNYDESTNHFNTDILDKTIKKIAKTNFSGNVVIKSTVPVGYTKKISDEFSNLKIIFSPEFLREGSSFKDINNASRVIAGGEKKYVTEYFNLLKEISDFDTKYFKTHFNEAEAIKLFSNTYLAMRISFFNELDSYCLEKKLDSRSIIQGVCMDKRIGDFYNNPSFGYGGYCLPKDTKQLVSNYESVPQDIISSIVSANATRKDYLANLISSKNHKNIGIYGLSMKKGSDNFRESSIVGIMERLQEKNHEIVIYEPSIVDTSFKNYKVEKSFENFIEDVDIIIANRIDKKIIKYKDKIFTRDIFQRD